MSHADYEQSDQNCFMPGKNNLSGSNAFFVVTIILHMSDQKVIKLTLDELIVVMQTM